MNKTIKIILWLVVAIIVIGGIWYGVSKKPTVSTTKEPIKIGVILDLSGPAVGDNTKIKKGIELALEEINSKGGINGRKIELVWEDDKCDAKEGVSAFHKLTSLYKFPVIIGGSCSSVTLAIAPLAENNKIVLISPYSNNPQLTTAGDYIFRTVPSDTFEGKLTAEFIAQTLKAKNIGILYVNNDYGRGLADVLSSRFRELNGNILIEEPYDLKATDFRTSLLKIKNKNPEVIYIAGYQKALINILKQIKELEIIATVVGTSLMEDPQIIKEAENASEGVIFGSAFFDPTEEFQSKFQNKYKEKAGALEAIGYDTLNLVVKAIERGGYTSEGIKNALYSMEYDGALGHLTFDRNGDINWPKLTIKTIKNGQFVPYEK